MSTETNILSPARNEILRRFGMRIEGSPEAFFLVVGNKALSAEARDALTKTALALQWSAGATYVAFDDPAPLQKAELYEIIEGLDPVCVVLCGQHVCTLAEEAYAQEIPRNKRFRLFGHDVCALQDIEEMLADEKGKRQAWELLKSLPSCSE